MHSVLRAPASDYAADAADPTYENRRLPDRATTRTLPSPACGRGAGGEGSARRPTPQHPREAPTMKFVGQLLAAQLARHPAMQLADVYKLLHQAALGSAHAVDAATAGLDSSLRWNDGG